MSERASDTASGRLGRRGHGVPLVSVADDGFRRLVDGETFCLSEFFDLEPVVRLGLFLVGDCNGWMSEETFEQLSRPLPGNGLLLRFFLDGQNLPLSRVSPLKRWRKYNIL